MRLSSKPGTKSARTLRRAITLPEVVLWGALRTRPAGLKFRRQHPAGVYVLDFYYDQARLAIEVDGMAHNMGKNPARDRRRDEWLAEQGVRALRMPRAMFWDLESVVRLIVEQCQPLHHPADGPPPLQGGIL